MPKYLVNYSLHGQLVVEAENPEKIRDLIDHAVITDHQLIGGISHDSGMFDSDAITVDDVIPLEG